MAGDKDLFTGLVRWDDENAIPSSWSESTSKETTFSTTPNNFINKAKYAKTVSIRVYDFSGDGHEAKFRLHGLGGAMARHPELCGR